MGAILAVTARNRNMTFDTLCQGWGMVHTAVDMGDAQAVVEAPPRPVSVGLRERKKEQTRRALEDAALDLFERQGFDHTTVEEIAAVCDVSPRTFFRYFATKDQVLFGDEGEFSEMLADLEQRPADEPPLRSVRAVVDAKIESSADEPDRLVRRARVIAATPSLQIHGPYAEFAKLEAVVDALARRDAAAGIRPRLLELRLGVGVGFAAIRAALDTWIADGATGDLFAMVDEAFNRVEAGLGT
jgi:AcrR family transcriptional regulator